MAKKKKVTILRKRNLIGYIMIAFTEKKQGLHDIIAKCLVVNKE